VQPTVYAQRARQWLQQGAAIIGGCCGTTPDHIAALNNVMRPTGRPCPDA
jgi:S-methylmethionine-dependent homocysteine/selenocysteine methylase